MQIIKNNFHELDEVSTIAYCGNLKLLGFEKICQENINMWVALIKLKNITYYKTLKFIRYRDKTLPNVKYSIIIENTVLGDIDLVNFKPTATYSILEIIPQDLLEHLDNIA